MKNTLKIIHIFLAILLTILVVRILWVCYPDGGASNTITYQIGGVSFIWKHVGFYSFLASLFWAKVFLKTWKAFAIAVSVWIAVGTFYTVIDVSIRHNIKTPTDLLSTSDWWEPVHGDTFRDGGSMALSLMNGNGEVMHLWAYCTGLLKTNEPQHVRLVMNYNARGMKINPGSDLEKQLIKLLDNLYIRSEQEAYIPLVEDFKSVLLDRTNHVNEEFTGKLIQTE